MTRAGSYAFPRSTCRHSLDTTSFACDALETCADQRQPGRSRFPRHLCGRTDRSSNLVVWTNLAQVLRRCMARSIGHFSRHSTRAQEGSIQQTPKTSQRLGVCHQGHFTGQVPRTWTASERREAISKLLRISQQENFPNELAQLRDELRASCQIGSCHSPRFWIKTLGSSELEAGSASPTTTTTSSVRLSWTTMLHW